MADTQGYRPEGEEEEEEELDETVCVDSRKRCAAKNN